MNTTFKLVEVTDRRNGYGMPIVKVESNTNLRVYNRGYNEFECEQEIDESNLLVLREKLRGEKWAHLEITTPERDTNCWYMLDGRNETRNIIW